jgi:hypothetical protein
LLNHKTLRLNDENTQIDHVLVSRFGIFVIETKDYGGWIFGGPGDRNWTQVLFRTKFQKPIRQIYKHGVACPIRALLLWRNTQNCKAFCSALRGLSVLTQGLPRGPRGADEPRAIAKPAGCDGNGS